MCAAEGGQEGHTIGLLARAWEVLVARAREGRTITYGEMATAMLLSPQSAQFTDTLNELSRTENTAGRGLLSVLVIRQREGTPGSGFFRLARELGHQFDDDEQFFREEVERVTAQWQARPVQATPTKESIDKAEPPDESSNTQEDSDYEPMDLDEDEEDNGAFDVGQRNPFNRILSGLTEAGGGLTDAAKIGFTKGRIGLMKGRTFIANRRRRSGDS